MAIVETGYLQTPYLSQLPYMAGLIEDGQQCQVDLKIASDDDDPTVLTQVDLRAEKTVSLNMQVKFGDLGHYICGGYLNDLPYMSEKYLGPRLCAELLTQVNLKPTKNVEVLTQVDQRIVSDADDPDLLMQVKLRIENTLNQLNAQVLMLRATKLNTQVNLVIYNDTQLRLLCEFPSRGTAALGGLNWTSVQAINPGDFSPNNLNTDIVEQRTETSTIANWQLRCDTGNTNTFADTIGILNHNFTVSARVEVAGSDDAAFGTIKFSFVMETEVENMYYVASSLPNLSARYYQFTIQDPSNSTGKLSIGTIVFGSAVIMGLKEQFLNPVTFGKRHFKDSLETEGFTSVSNDRSIRRFLNLTYAQLIREGANFRALQSYILAAKTDLKCLIIPRPTLPSTLAVFAKLSQLPEELHSAIEDDNWRIDMTFDWDESL